MKKHLLSVLVLLSFVSTLVTAQEAMKVDFNADKADFVMSELHKITFEGDNFYVHFKNGEILPFSFNNLNLIAFGEKSPSGINENKLSAQNINLFPNPVSKYLNISIKTESDVQITIINLEGERVLFKQGPFNSERIDVSHLLSGIYLIQFQIDNTTSTKMFIKN